MSKLLPLALVIIGLSTAQTQEIGTVSKEELVTTLTKALSLIDPPDYSNSGLIISGTISGVAMGINASAKTPTVLETLVEKQENEKAAAENKLQVAKEKLAIANRIRNLLKKLEK